MTFAAGDVIRAGKYEIERLPFTSGTINKGAFIKSTSGNAVQLATGNTTITGRYVAVETKTFVAGGRDNDIQLAGEGAYVVVLMGGVVQPGGPVIVNTGEKATVGSAANIAAAQVVGRYIKHPGERVATPSADNDLGIIRIGGA
jgi:hypothetical protein